MGKIAGFTKQFGQSILNMGWLLGVGSLHLLSFIMAVDGVIVELGLSLCQYLNQERTLILELLSDSNNGALRF